MRFCEAKNPAVNNSESPGKKKPKNKPDSAKTINTTPSKPKVFMIVNGSKIECRDI